MMPPLKKIVVTGSTGQLGTELKELSATYPAYTFYFLSRTELALDNEEAIAKTIATLQPDYVINCAAYTAVDKAEAEKEVALQINGTAVGALAAACTANSARLIHISTDYVFDGTATKPLREDDSVAPVNYYGQSKLTGEELAVQQAPDCIIIRTSWVYSYHGKNFVKTMMRLMTEKETISVVNDQRGSPTYAADLAAAIMQIISGNTWHPGIYHYSNEGNITWADFAQQIKTYLHSSCQVVPVGTDQYPTPAKRPACSLMDKSKIAATYNIPIKPWQQSLQTCIKKLTAQ